MLINSPFVIPYVCNNTDLTCGSSCDWSEFLNALTQVQPLTQRAQSLQDSQLQFVGHSVRVNGSSVGTDWSLMFQRGAQLG